MSLFAFIGTFAIGFIAGVLTLFIICAMLISDDDNIVKEAMEEIREDIKESER